MKWENVSSGSPGFSAYRASVGDRTFEMRMKRSMGFWRLFVRDSADETLRTILHSPTMGACKEYAEEYVQRNQ